MFWVIHYRNGVAMTDANDRDAAEDWCKAHLGISEGPFAITPAIHSDFESVCLDTITEGGQAAVQEANVAVIGKEREARSYPALKLATRH